MNHGLERLADSCHSMPTDPRGPREAARRGARVAPDTGGTASEPDGSGRSAARWPTRPSSPRRRTKSLQRSGRWKRSYTRPTTFPSWWKSRSRPCAVRDHPSLPRWQWPRGAAADYVPPMRAKGAREAGAVSLALLQAPPAGLLRSPTGRKGHWRLGALARLLPAWSREGECPGHRAPRVASLRCGRIIGCVLPIISGVRPGTGTASWSTRRASHRFRA